MALEPLRGRAGEKSSKRFATTEELRTALAAAVSGETGPVTMPSGPHALPQSGEDPVSWSGAVVAAASSTTVPTESSRRVPVVAIALVAATRVRQLPVLVPVDLRRAALASGTLSAVAVAAFTVGAQQGSLAEIAITTALAPAVTAGLAAVYAGDPFRWWQMIGAGICCAGVAMVGAA